MRSSSDRKGPLRRLALAMAAMLALCAAPAHAQSKTGTTVGQFLLIEPSARIAAMGNAGVSMAEDLQGVYYNPASIAQLDHTGVAFSHADWLDEQNASNESELWLSKNPFNYHPNELHHRLTAEWVLAALKCNADLIARLR